jgi:hypothetical protein
MEPSERRAYRIEQAEDLGMERLGHSSEIELPDGLSVPEEFNQAGTDGMQMNTNHGDFVYKYISDGDGAIVFRHEREQFYAEPPRGMVSTRESTGSKSEE